MFRRWAPALLAVVLVAWLGNARPARAEGFGSMFWHYPYYPFPHSYWPTNSAPYPEAPGAPYRRPPAYMAYPPFLEKYWRYDLWKPMPYYRGFHFWLDQF